jgi:hypothetical protein
MEQESLSNNSVWSASPMCSCTGGGKAIDFNGEKVIFRDPACRVHLTTSHGTYAPVSAESIAGSWTRREVESVKN